MNKASSVYANRCRLNQPAGFTLVELLTVIVIVSILLALVISGIGTIREKTLQAACAANLRQIASAIELYAGDNDGRLPGPAWVTLPTHVEWYTSIEHQPLGAFLAPYLMPEANILGAAVYFKVFDCPTYQLHPDDPFAAAPYYRTYDDIMPFGDVSSSGTDLPMKLVQLDSLYGKPLSEIYAIKLRDSDIQRGGSNTLFFDGHVEWVKAPVP